MWFLFFFQLRVHCAEALGTPIVGDYKYGWFVHSRWKQMPRVDIEPTTGKPYKMRRPEGLDVQKGSVLSKVPLLHLHCRELALPNIAKFLDVLEKNSEELHPSLSAQPDVLRFVATMPNHMRISWNLMSSYLIWGKYLTRGQTNWCYILKFWQVFFYFDPGRSFWHSRFLILQYYRFKNT